MNIEEYRNMALLETMPRKDFNKIFFVSVIIKQVPQHWNWYSGLSVTGYPIKGSRKCAL